MAHYPSKRLRALLPMELHAIAAQLQRPDGRFRFLVQWRILGAGILKNGPAIRKSTIWEAGSIEELLHAIAAANAAISQCAGVNPAPPTKGRDSGPGPCPRCGRYGKLGHAVEECDKALAELGKRAILGNYLPKHRRDARWRLKRNIIVWAKQGRKLKKAAENAGIDWLTFGGGWTR